MNHAPFVMSVALIVASVARADEPSPPAPGSAEYIAQMHTADEKANVAAGLDSDYPFEIPTVASNRFAEGDGLLITTVRGTEPTFVVGGRYLFEGVYKLSNLPKANLMAFVTNQGFASRTRDEPAQHCLITAPNGHFALQLPVGWQGSIRIAFYPVPRGQVAGGLYLQDARPTQNVPMQPAAPLQP